MMRVFKEIQGVDLFGVVIERDQGELICGYCKERVGNRGFIYEHGLEIDGVRYEAQRVFNAVMCWYCGGKKQVWMSAS